MNTTNQNAPLNNISASLDWAGPYLQRQTKYGFRNPGSLCYRNAIMILLLHTPALVNWVESYNCQNNCGEVPSCFFCRFQALCRFYWIEDPDKEGEQSAHSNRHNQLLQSIWKSTLRNGWMISGQYVTDHDQQDIGEFLCRFFDVLEQETTASFPMLNTFDFAISKDRICKDPKCGNTTALNDDLSKVLLAPFSGGRNPRLRNLIANSLVDDDIQATCNSCKGQQVTLRSKLKTPPEVFLVHARRAVYNVTKARLEKIKRVVNFDEELVMGQGAEKETRYELFAVVFHSGNQANSGHYYTAVKGPTGQWALVNDDKVSFDSLKTFQKLYRNDASLFAYRKMHAETSGVKASPVTHESEQGKLEASIEFKAKGIVMSQQPLNFPLLRLENNDPTQSVRLQLKLTSKAGDIYEGSADVLVRLKRLVNGKSKAKPVSKGKEKPKGIVKTAKPTRRKYSR